MSQSSAVKAAFNDEIGVSDLSTDLDSGQAQSCLNALNAAIESIAAFAPAFWYGTDHFASIIRAPVTASFTGMANGSKAFSWSGLASNSWAHECATLLPGDDLNHMANRIKKTSSGAELLLPYIGTSSSNDATIYQDMIAMPQDFLKMKGGVKILGVSEIDLVFREDNTIPQYIGDPTMARLVARTSSSGTRVAMMKLNALSPAIRRIAFEYYRRPPALTSWSDSRDDLVMIDYVSSVLIPISLQKLVELTALVSDDRKSAIASGSNAAYRILEEISDAENGSTPGRITTGNW